MSCRMKVASFFGNSGDLSLPWQVLQICVKGGDSCGVDLPSFLRAQTEPMCSRIGPSNNAHVHGFDRPPTFKHAHTLQHHNIPFVGEGFIPPPLSSQLRGSPPDHTKFHAFLFLSRHHFALLVSLQGVFSWNFGDV